MRASVPTAVVPLAVVLVVAVAAHGTATPRVGPTADGPAALRVGGAADGPPTRQSTTTLGGVAAAIRGGPSTGESVATGDVDGDGEADVLVGVPFDDAGGPNAGAAYLFLGPVTGDRGLEDADAVLVGARPGDWAGFAVAVADVDADGRGEAVVGAPLRDGGAGGVYVVDAPSGTVALGEEPVVPGPADARLGRAVAGAGDVAGGPGEEVLAGAPAAAQSAGAAYLLTGETVAAGSVAAAAATYRGTTAGDRAGWAVAAGDVDDDGRPEAVVGAREARDGAGAVYVTSGPGRAGERGANGAPTPLRDAGAVVVGPPGASAGWSVATGDVDGDGVPDVLVGAPESGAAGAAFVVRGGDLPGRVVLGDATPVFVGRGAGDSAGWAVAVAGGDCDGGKDVLVGAPHADVAGTDAGAVYRVGPNGSAVVTYAGERPGDYAGYRLATGGDVTDDDRADAVVGAPGNESSAAAGGEATAAAYVVAGDCPATEGPSGGGAASTPATGVATATRTGSAQSNAGATPSSPVATPTAATADSTDAVAEGAAEEAVGGTADPARTPGLPGVGAAVAAVAVVLAGGLAARRRRG